MQDRAEREPSALRNRDSDLHAAAGRRNLRGSLDRPRNWPLVHEMVAADDGGTGNATSGAASVIPAPASRVPGFTANKPDPE